MVEHSPNARRCAACGDLWPHRCTITVPEEGPRCPLHGEHCDYDNAAARWFCADPGCGYEVEDSYEYGG